MDEARLYDRVYACWLGKNIGGTLGAPVEGRMEEMNITFYPRLPQGVALPNDDLDLQLVALHALEAHGTALTAADIAAEWTEHVYFPWDEYGYASTAMRLGFIPPFSGAFDNPFTDCMGAPIRSEIWSAVCAGDPQAAASFALRDAAVDHAGGEGVWGEVFNAAAGAVAFECDDIGEIIGAALECVPPKSRVAGAVRLALDFIEGNDRARRLYEKCGFTVTGELPDAIRLRDGRRLSLYTMICPLDREGETPT